MKMFLPLVPIAAAALFLAADIHAQAPAAAGVRDGTYRCHKLSPNGGLRSVGNLIVRGGKGAVPTFPTGWTIKQIFVRATNARGQPVVAVDYVSKSGISDRLDCVP